MNEEVPRFTNLAIDLGVDNPNMCGGVILDDFNRDNLVDIFTCGWGLKERCYLLLNKGDGTFDDVSVKAGISDFPGGLMIQQTDYNNDGLLDVWISRGATPSGSPLILLLTTFRLLSVFERKTRLTFFATILG